MVSIEELEPVEINKGTIMVSHLGDTLPPRLQLTLCLPALLH